MADSDGSCTCPDSNSTVATAADGRCKCRAVRGACDEKTGGCVCCRAVLCHVARKEEGAYGWPGWDGTLTFGFVLRRHAQLSFHRTIYKADTFLLQGPGGWSAAAAFSNGSELLDGALGKSMNDFRARMRVFFKDFAEKGFF